MQYQLLPIKIYGWCAVAWTEHGLAALTLPFTDPAAARAELASYLKTDLTLLLEHPDQHYLITRLHQQLTNYFAGKQCNLNFPVDLTWCTPFQQRVLQYVKYLPYGKGSSYRQVAEIIGKPKASRAVGSAVGANRVLLVIPCHRVLRSDGRLGGFGGGIEWKKRLLRLEKVSWTEG
jgi:methylated-DNA-[protein]-cysteine S-methyltransferase